MITEKQISEFEQKAKDDALIAFNELLSTYKAQAAHVQKINEDMRKQKDLLSKWAEEAHYRVNWDKYEAKQFAIIGECMRCNKKNIGLLKYSDYKDGYMVCDPCCDRLCDEFDDEMK